MMLAGERVHINGERQRSARCGCAVGADLEGVAMERAEDSNGFQQASADHQPIAFAGHLQLALFFGLLLPLLFLLALLLGFQFGDFFCAEYIYLDGVSIWCRGCARGACGSVKCPDTRQFFIQMARNGGFDGLGALSHERLHSIECLAQSAGFIDLSKDMLARSSCFQGPMEQLAKFIAVDFQASGGLVDTYLKDLFNFFIGQVRCFDEKMGQRRVPGDDTGSGGLASHCWQWAGEVC